jgi:hypothetical protein
LAYVFLGNSWQESWYMPLLLNGADVLVLYLKCSLVELMVLKVVFKFVLLNIQEIVRVTLPKNVKLARFYLLFMVEFGLGYRV